MKSVLGYKELLQLVPVLLHDANSADINLSVIVEGSFNGEKTRVERYEISFYQVS
jgi:hypothetical protein